MNYRVIPSTIFLENSMKLSKKYPSFKDELESLCNYMVENLYFGRHISDKCYIIRMEISSKKVTKFSNTRVLLSIKIVKDIVYLLSVNDIDGFNEEVDVWLS